MKIKQPGETLAQRRAERDVKLALLVWRLTSKYRRERMPFTVGFLQANAAALGYPIGEHRAAAAIRELKRRRTLLPAGNYRSRRHGFRVILYRVAAVTSSVRRRRAVKWWEHPLFGNPGGQKPKGLSERLSRWREPPARKKFRGELLYEHERQVGVAWEGGRGVWDLAG